MGLTDFDKILKEYDEHEDDFGFSAISEKDYAKEITTSTQTAEEYKKRLEDVEKLIIPFLKKLLATADKEYIHWPNRQPVIEQQIQKIIKLTRG
jgi:hypothetical protein